MNKDIQKEKTVSVHITGAKVAAFFIVAALWGASLWTVCKMSEKRILEKRNVEEESLYPLLNPRLRNLEKEERLKRVFPTLIPLREKFNDFLGVEKDNVSFYVEDLGGGAWCGWKERDEFFPASLLKVPVAIGVMKKVDNGEWTMGKEFTLEEKHKDKGFGNLWKSSNGTKFTLENLAEEMLKNSDNTATNILFMSLSPEERDEVYYHIGLVNPENPDPENNDGNFFRKLSARNLATMFRALYNATYLTRESSDYILEILTKTEFDSNILKVIPREVRVAHKIAAFDDRHLASEKNYHDCGIVFFSDHPYLYCFMTKDLAAPEAEKMLQGLNKIAYEHFVFRK